MRLRKFDESADYRFGQGASQFWKDQPDGVAQKVGQRLQLWRGQWYLDSGEGMGKAGGYAIQGRAEAFVRFLSGSHSGVVGLPVFETRALLESAGYPLG